MSATSTWGLVRSLVIYHQPHRRVAWRKFYQQLIKKGDLVFDVGAHVGSRTRTLRSVGARVVAIEPQQQFARFLAKTLPRDVVLVQAALGARNSLANLATSSKHPTVSSLQSEFVETAKSTPGFERVTWDSSELVEVVTLDSLLEKHGTPKYIKIDVEGYELEVLKGLTKPVELISFEYLPSFSNLTTQVLKRLAELGSYTFNTVVGEKAQFHWTDWQNQETVESWLASHSHEAKSGDLFARLEHGK